MDAPLHRPDTPLHPPKEYWNFDLFIRRRDDGLYDLEAHDPKGGKLWRRGVRLDAPPVDAPPVDAPPVDAPPVDAPEAIGRRLFTQVFQGEVIGSFRDRLGQAREEGRGLRLRLRLDEAPELANWPWELLYDAKEHRFLGHSVDTPIVRYLELQRSHEPLACDSPLRVLAVVASPKDKASLAADAEWRRLKDALDPLENLGLVAVERLQPPTLDALVDALSSIHLVHFIGHGDVVPSPGGDARGVLFFEDGAGQSDAVSGERLGKALIDSEPRLVFLNCCHSATPVQNAPVSGVAEALLRQGVAAVVGIGDDLGDDDAVSLTSHFYRGLAEGLPVDQSLGKTRKAMALRDDTDAWSLPRLFMRCDDGVLFRLPGEVPDPSMVSEVAATPELPPPWRRFTWAALLVALAVAGWGASHLWTSQTVRQLNAQALELLDAQRLDEARRTVQSAIDRKPSHSDSWSHLGAVETAAGRSKEALDAYAQAAQLAPGSDLHGYNHASALLDHRLFERAIEQLLVVLGLEPQHGPAHNDLGWAYLEIGRRDLARPWLAQGLQLSDLEPPTRAALHKNYGRLSYETDDLPSAEEHLREALRTLDPTQTTLRLEARLLLAATHERQGETVQACRALQQFAEDGGLLYRWSADPLELAQRLQCPIVQDLASIPLEPSLP